MKLRVLAAGLPGKSLVPRKIVWILSCALLLPLTAWTAEATPVAADDEEQELVALRQLAQQMLTRIEALERKQRAKKGLPPLAGAGATQPAALPAPPPVVQPAAPAAPAAPLKLAPKAFQFVGNTVFGSEALGKVLAADIGKEVDLGGLQDATDKIKEFYHAKGYFLAQAILPPQDVSDGTVKIQVVEGRIGKITFKPLPPNAPITQRQFEGMIASSLKEGDLITENGLERPLLKLRDLPGVDVASTINAGSREGTSDLELEIKKVEKRVFTNIEFDNAGNRFAGEYRLTTKSTLNNVFGIGDSFSATLTAGYSPLNLFGRIGYLVPLGYSGLRAGFNLSRLNYLLGKDFAQLGVEGDATIGDLLAVYPFLRNKEYNLFGQVALESKRLSDRQANAPGQRRKINALKFQANGDLRGVGNVNTGSLDLTIGRLTFDNPVDLVEDQGDNGFHTAGDFYKANFSANRLQVLGKNLEAWMAVTGQIASKNLTSAEKFVLGGPSRVRGYPAGEAGGDSGLVLTGELRYAVPKFTFGKAKLGLSAFVDYGWVQRNQRQDEAARSELGSKNNRSLYSIGVGFNFGAPDQYVFRSDLAWGLSGPATSDTKSSNPRLWFQGVKWF